MSCPTRHLARPLTAPSISPKPAEFKWFERPLPESQGQNLAVTVLHVPDSFDLVTPLAGQPPIFSPVVGLREFDTHKIVTALA